MHESSDALQTQAHRRGGPSSRGDAGRYVAGRCVGAWIDQERKRVVGGEVEEDGGDGGVGGGGQVVTDSANPRRGSPVAPSVAAEPPWYERYCVMILCLPVYRRARRIAASLASPPEEGKLPQDRKKDAHARKVA